MNTKLDSFIVAVGTAAITLLVLLVLFRIAQLIGS